MINITLPSPARYLALAASKYTVSLHYRDTLSSKGCVRYFTLLVLWSYLLSCLKVVILKDSTISNLSAAGAASFTGRAAWGPGRKRQSLDGLQGF